MLYLIADGATFVFVTKAILCKLHFDVPSTGKRRFTMKLHENLQLCLLALASRFPDDIVEVDEAILDLHIYAPDGLTPLDMIGVLHRTNPQLLQTEACLVMNAEESSIYLPDRSERMPAFCIHCPAAVSSHVGVRAKSSIP
jgi:hypothetical protein